LPDSVANYLQMAHDTYSRLLWFDHFYIDIQIQFDNDIVFLDDRLAHDNIFYNIFFI